MTPASGVGRSAEKDDKVPDRLLRALEDRHLIKGRREASKVSYEIQHPRLIEAVRNPVSRVVPARRAGAAARLQEAAVAFCSTDFELARLHVKATIRACGGTDLPIRAAAECFLGDVAHAEGELDEAARRYEAAAGMFEALTNTQMVGQLLCAVGRLSLDKEPGQAIQKLTAAASRLPHDPYVQTALGQALWQKGQSQTALAVLNGVLSKDEDTSEALRIRGEILTDLGEVEPALRDLHRVDHSTNPSTRAAWVLANALHAGTTPDRDELDETASINPENGHTLLRVALVRQLHGEPLDAAKFAGRALRAKHPPLPPQLLKKAESLKKGT